MKILIVEDEFYNRKALVKMIYSEVGAEDEIIEASNGYEALEIIKQTMIDVVCTDIRMPEMDGLELIEEIYKLKREIWVIVISGYAEFEYAQKALRFGVEDYLLKPVRKSKIQKLILKVKEKIASTNQKVDEAATIKENLEDAWQHVFIQKLVALMLHGEMNHLDEIKTFLNIKDTFYVYSLILVATESSSDSTNPMAISELDRLDEDYQRIFCVPNTYLNGYHILIAFDFQSEQHMNLVTIPRCLKDINDCCKNSILRIGTSTIQNDLCRLNISHNEALKASYMFYFDMTMKSFYYGDYDIDKQMKDLKEQLEGLKYCIYLQDSKQIYKALEVFFDVIKEQRSVEWLLGLDDMIEEISQDRNFNRSIIDNEDYLDMPVFRSIHFSGFKDLEHYFLNITNYILAVCYHSSGGNIAVSLNIVNAAKIYLDDHYHDLVSQDLMAKDILFVNTSYFSRIFKKHEGVTFSKYLKELRLSKAKILLVQHDYPLSQISGMVGFNDTSYFISSFRNQYCITPGEYRIKDSL